MSEGGGQFPSEIQNIPLIRIHGVLNHRAVSQGSIPVITKGVIDNDKRVLTVQLHEA